MVGRKTAQQSDALADQREYEQPRRQDALRYIAEMAGELASLAGAERMPMLTYFLNMARVEAEMGVSDGASAQHAVARAKPARRRTIG